MSDEDKRKFARSLAIAAGITYVVLFFVSFSLPTPAMTYSRWAALAVLGIAWSYSSARRPS